MGVLPGSSADRCHLRPLPALDSETLGLYRGSLYSGRYPGRADENRLGIVFLPHYSSIS